MRQKNKPREDQQRPTLSGSDQARVSGVRTGSRFEEDARIATARDTMLEPMRWKASGEKEGRRRETKWRPSLRETLRKDRATGLRGWPKPPYDNAPDPNQPVHDFESMTTGAGPAMRSIRLAIF